MEDSLQEMPYPATDGITADGNSVRIVAPAYASECGELNTVLQYVYQRVQLKGQGYDDFADRVGKIAVQEMRHLEALGGMLLRLGVAPVYVAYPAYPANFYTARSVSYSRLPPKIFIDDIAAEQSAIASYEGMLRRLTNERVAAVIGRILLDERAHLQEFQAMLREFNGGH